MNIGIVGAGLVGRLLAWRLLRAGHGVSLFDQDDGSGQQAAGFIAAAMLAPYSETVGTGHDLLAPGLQSIALWQEWLNELHEEVGERVFLQQRGSLVVAHPLDRKELQWFQQKLRALASGEIQDFPLLDRPTLRSLEPALTAFDEGLYLPQEACLDNRALFHALTQAITCHGGLWYRDCKVHSLSNHCIEAEQGSHRFDLVCDCRGFSAKEQLQGLRGVRGELLWVHAPEVHLSRPIRLMHPRYQLYIAPRPDQIYVIGATELESESMTPVTVRSELELLSALYSVHEGFSEASILEARSHCRPAFPNNLPRLIAESGLLRLNGLYRHGYLLGPLLVESALNLLRDELPRPPIEVVGDLHDAHKEPSYA